MTLKEYLQAPCQRASLPYWKAREAPAPRGIRIVHDGEMGSEDIQRYTDEPYFRLLCDLTANGPWCSYESPPGFHMRQAKPEDIPIMADIINRSYSDISVTGSQLAAEMALPVYRPCLWIMMEEKASGDCVGCAMAQYDSEAREVSLEWVQVLPEYRHRHIGKAMVCRVLSSMRGTARFATVSGKVNSSSNPQALYRSCGFSGDDVWHILRES